MHWIYLTRAPGFPLAVGSQHTVTSLQEVVPLKGGIFWEWRYYVGQLVLGEAVTTVTEVPLLGDTASWRDPGQHGGE